MPSSYVKFSTRIDGALLDEVRALAKDEGRKIQAIAEEALGNLLEERRKGKARAHVMRAYRSSHVHYSSLYEKLAS